MVEIPVREPQRLEEGSYNGVIDNIEYREEPMPYTDYYIKVDGQEYSIRTSFPTCITEETLHGKMLMRFGVKLIPGSSVNPDQLKGKRCRFMVVVKTTPRGTFPEIVRDSLKPDIEAVK